MANPKLYLHIGSPKTGTTSFQRYLNDNFRSLLVGLRLYYPFCEKDDLLSEFCLASGSEEYFAVNEVRHNNGQRIMACSEPFSLLARVGEVARERQVDVVISDESFSVFSHPGTPFVAALMEIFEVVPVVVIKDPLEFLFSAYLQTIKASPYLGALDDFVSAQPGGAIQFRFYREWCERFRNIRVLSFKNIKNDLLGNLLQSFGRSRDSLVAFKVGCLEMSNVSLAAECYAIIRDLNRSGFRALARKFASLYEVSGVKGDTPRPDPAYYDAACLLHDGLFDYLSEHLNMVPSEFISDGYTSSRNGFDVLQTNCFSGESLRVLLQAVGETYEFDKAKSPSNGEYLDSPCHGSALFEENDPIRRIFGLARDMSPWGEYCPSDFSVKDYIELGGILNTRPYEELRGFDPYRHYAMYGRYSGYAVKRDMSILGQVELFRDSPFVSYVPNGFDAEKYLSLNHDVHAAGVDPYHHYWAYGVKEARLFR